MEIPFHEGELAVQRRAGVERTAAQVGRIIGSAIPPEFAAFLERQPFVIAAAPDEDGRVWASLLVGSTRALDDRELVLGAPLGVPTGTRVGILAIEFDTRSRIRLNGTTTGSDPTVVVVDEVFGNCPKYIQRRVPVERLGAPEEPVQHVGPALDDRQRALVARADTFFIATLHHERGADASHRGGNPGFVRVASDGRSLRFPDYTGNRMFQTLGNLTVDPRAGLLFVDWETGGALELSGLADIVWDGTERAVEFEVEAVRERPGALGARWVLSEPPGSR